MEILNQIWQVIAPYFTGVTIAGLFSAVIYGCLKGAFSRTISKINVEKIADQATTKGVERVKKVTFTHSIQPLVESEMKKVSEETSKMFKKELEEVKANYNNLVAVLEKLSAYFDGSIGVSEQAKAELKQALADAKKEPTAAESVASEEFIEPEQKAAVDPVETAKKHTKSVR